MSEMPLPDSAVPLPAAPVEGEPKPAAPLLTAATERHGKLASLMSEALAAGERGLDNPDVVHDLRVGSRRLGEVAKLLGIFLDKPTAKAVQESLKTLRRAMGELRDSDVTREHLAKWKMPAALKTVAKEVAARLEADRAALAAKAREALGSASVQGAMVILARIIEDNAKPDAAEKAEQQLEELVRSQLRKRTKAMRNSFGKAAAKQTPDALHEARIAIKKLRYIAEMASDASLTVKRKNVHTRTLKSQVKFFKNVQELLGDHHDAHVILTTLEQHLADAREKPIQSLPAAWRKFKSALLKEQSKRAALFFMKTYEWMSV
jgi:CHAD domain-containing protein